MCHWASLFFKKRFTVLFLINSVYVIGYVCVLADARGVTFPGTGIRGGCELCDIVLGAELCLLQEQ